MLMRVCVYVGVFAYVCVSLRVYVFMRARVCGGVGVWVCVYARVHVCVHVRKRERERERERDFLRVSLCINTNTNTRAKTNTTSPPNQKRNTDTQIEAETHRDKSTHSRTHMSTTVCVYVRKYMCCVCAVNQNMCMYASTHVHQIILNTHSTHVHPNSQRNSPAAVSVTHLDKVLLVEVGAAEAHGERALHAGTVDKLPARRRCDNHIVDNARSDEPVTHNPRHQPHPSHQSRV